MAFRQYDPITLQDVQDELDDKLAINSLLDKVYPVGTIYMSLNDESPSSFIGGHGKNSPKAMPYGLLVVKQVILLMLDYLILLVAWGCPT